MKISRAPHDGLTVGIKGTLLAILSVFVLLDARPAPAQTFTVDTSAASPLTGLWWNANESGWGATITQQSNMLFITMFVYDSAGNPVWYTVSCAIAGTSCNGDMLKFRGGVTPDATGARW